MQSILSSNDGHFGHQGKRYHTTIPAQIKRVNVRVNQKSGTHTDALMSG